MPYEEAADTYRLLEDEERTDVALGAAQRIRFALNADLNGGSVAHLKMLFESGREPIARAHAAIRLARQAADTNDLDGAGKRAEVALAALAEAGYPDPASRPIGQIGMDWVAALTREPSPHFMTKLEEISSLAVQSLVHRCCAQMVDQPDAAHATHLAFMAFGQLVQEMMGHGFAAAAEIRERLLPYFPELPALARPPMAGFDAVIDINLRLQVLMENLRDAPYKMEQFEPESADILASAEANGPPNLIIQAAIARCTILVGLGRLEEADTTAEAGERVLFGGQPEAEALAGGIDLDFFVQLRWARLHAAALARRFEAVLALGTPTIRAIEAARGSISSPTQQATYLTRRTFVFECVAMAAFKLGAWDTLIAVSDLIKAKAAVRNRLAPLPSSDVVELQRHLRAVGGALATTVSLEERAELRRQRNELWELVGVSRWQHAARNGPELTLAALQETLDAGDALLSWLWVGRGVLIVLAIDRDRIHVEAIVLSDRQQDSYDGYVAGLRDGIGYSRALGGMIEAIGAFALPPATRDFIKGASRMKLAPHRGLHLVPFHAVRIDGQYLIERAAMSYVPNLASLLMPQRSAAQGQAISVGINEFTGRGLPDLKGAEGEAEAVASA